MPSPCLAAFLMGRLCPPPPHPTPQPPPPTAPPTPFTPHRTPLPPTPHRTSPHPRPCHPDVFKDSAAAISPCGPSRASWTHSGICQVAFLSLGHTQPSPPPQLPAAPPAGLPRPRLPPPESFSGGNGGTGCHVQPWALPPAASSPVSCQVAGDIPGFTCLLRPLAPISPFIQWRSWEESLPACCPGPSVCVVFPGFLVRPGKRRLGHPAAQPTPIPHLESLPVH